MKKKQKKKRIKRRGKVGQYNINVLEAAKQRVLNAFNHNQIMMLSFSGGKDSIAVMEVVLDVMQEHNISFKRLAVIFIDEEAIYPDVEKITREYRSKILALGGRFYWFCIQVKHFNCCNSLSNDESFICWEKGMEDRWVREMPKFAIRSHSRLREGVDTYQQFLGRAFKGLPTFTGVRVYESLMRRQALQNQKLSGEMDEPMIKPIYDWRDSDVWLYLLRYNIEFPMTYIYMYKVGVSRNNMRLSQFFSVDTIKNIPKVAEFYPKLYDRVLRREPNVEMVSLYYQTKMFRGGSKSDKRTYEEIKEEWEREWARASKYPDDYAGYYNIRKSVMPKMIKDFKYKKGTYKKLTGILVGGDPKNRTTRGLLNGIRGEHNPAT